MSHETTRRLTQPAQFDSYHGRKSTAAEDIDNKPVLIDQSSRRAADQHELLT